MFVSALTNQALQDTQSELSGIFNFQLDQAKADRAFKCVVVELAVREPKLSEVRAWPRLGPVIKCEFVEKGREILKQLQTQQAGKRMSE